MLAMYALLALIPVTLAVQATQGALEDATRAEFVAPPTWRVSLGWYPGAGLELAQDKLRRNLSHNR